MGECGISKLQPEMLMGEEKRNFPTNVFFFNIFV